MLVYEPYLSLEEIIKQIDADNARLGEEMLSDQEKEDLARRWHEAAERGKVDDGPPRFLVWQTDEPDPLGEN